MAGCNRSPRSDQHSIKYRWNQDRVTHFDADYFLKEYAPTLSSDKTEHKLQMLSMAELISTIGKIWESADRPLSFFQPKFANQDNKDDKKERIFGNHGLIGTLSDTHYHCIDTKAVGYHSSAAQPHLELLKVTEKMSAFESCIESHSFFQGVFQNRDNISKNSWKERGLLSEGISYNLGSIYGWMSEKSPVGLRNLVEVSVIEYIKTSNFPIDTLREDEASIPADKRTQMGDGSAVCNPDLITSNSLPLFDDQRLERKTTKNNCLSSNYFLTAVEDSETDVLWNRIHCSSLYEDYCINHVATSDSASDCVQLKFDGIELPENKRIHEEDSITNDESMVEAFSSPCQKPDFLAKQEHAYAGAFAGVFVSLCLHPVDTVKTVLQSCRAEKKSIFYIGKSIISDRGLSGLYRGIATNITSSAPISAVYTFTYESVKGALLPLLPKECHSFAHCAAGGCASIATSFIFTPSERIKQQMQVGSHYHNCRKALIGIIAKGGLPSLYAGWGAVLCRNIPHSIIKFYTYENLKQVMLSSWPSSGQPNPLQTLVCGGLAGSTAAFFTTPFDVVKTRLQTQIPGSTSLYDNVFHALCKIAKNEGLKGLYRGLAPRLLMYMSQGSLFFASYEFFKRVFSLEASQTTVGRTGCNYKNGCGDRSSEVPL